MFNFFKKPTATPDPEERRKIAAQKKAMEKILRAEGLSRKRATAITSITFKEVILNERFI
jgi:hypothetical protein